MNTQMMNIKNILISFMLVLFCSVFVMAQDSADSDSSTVKDLHAKLPKDDTCISCHIEEEVMPEGFNENDIHMQVGLSCVGCHGGDHTINDEDEAMDESRGFIGTPDKADIPEMCGKCHNDINFMREFQPRIATDQVQQYYTSGHGKKLKEGDENVATCTSCHTAHSILPAQDPRSTVYALNVPKTCDTCHGDESYMSDYSLSTDHFNQYAESVHGKALLEKEDTGAPACNDCHGNHGATPPGVASLAHVCGSCHVQNEEYFASTKMARQFANDDMHACIECHGNHAIEKPTDAMVGTGEESICMDCHDVGEKGYLAADSIHLMLTQVTSAYDSAMAKMQEVKVIGMDDVEIGFLLQDAHQDLIHSRTLVHTFDPTKVKEKAMPALQNSRDAIKLGIKELDDYDTRRMGLGIATLFITILAIALFFKVRDMEQNSDKE